MSGRHKARTRVRRWAATSALVALGLALLAGAAVVRFDHLRFEPVLSGSMRPGIQPGDLAVLRPVPVSQLRVGEIIAYLPSGYTVPVMHRIVSLDSRGLVTKGDANPVADPWGRVATRSPTVERLVAVIPKVGWLTEVRRQLLIGAGSVLLLALAAFLWTRDRKPRPSDVDADGGVTEHEVRQTAVLTRSKEN